ncbi:hypothetical protein P2H44_11990 [Albimonas sp. CAU 1670]|uniref:hypothetical protein n=1 Tax=Albimonas sp. CAU 1670 TaxID=3032599 RepID=UPI0023D97E32|nr:hypothetical protein [Albimonas sp. CAU 1670]MDF2233274.1 hypothetical protein [Albimonas sp. CAU 1670]
MRRAMNGPDRERPAGTGADAPGRAGRVRRLAQGGVAAAAAASVVLAGAPSDASDRTLTGRLTQTFLGDTNLQVDRSTTTTGGTTSSDGAALGSRSRLSVDYSDRTSTSLFRFAGDINYDAYTGSDNDNLTGLFPDLTASYELTGTRSVVQASLFGSAQPVDFLDFSGFSFFDPNAEPTPIDPTDPTGGTPNLSAASREAIRVIYGASFSYDARVNSRDSTNVAFTLQRRDFVDGGPGLTPSNQFTVATGWSRQVSTSTTAGLTFNGSMLKAEGTTDTETYTMSVAPTLTYAATPAQVYNVSLGPRWSVTDRKEPLAGGGFDPDTSYSLGLRASAGMTYAYDNVETALSLNQDVTPNDNGDAVNRTSINASLRHRITPTTTLLSRIGASIETPLDSNSTNVSEETIRVTYNAGLNYQVNSLTRLDFNLGSLYRDDGVDRDVVISAGAGYRYSLTQDTGMRLGYDFRMPMGDIDDEDDSHRLSLTLTHDFTLLP